MSFQGFLPLHVPNLLVTKFAYHTEMGREHVSGSFLGDFHQS